MHNTASRPRDRGFTIIEVMIAMAIFTVIVTIGIGSVLAAIEQHHASEDISTVMNNLDFAMEDMTRNLRLGTNFHCMASGEAALTFGSDTDPVVPEDCAVPSGAHNEIVFNDQNGDHVTYDISTGLGGSPSQIFKQKGSGSPQLVSPPEVAMDFAKSGFIVRGSLPGDGGQPTVTIKLAGTVTSGGVTSAFAIETTVVLRNLDS